ncbi:MAG: hypothetical protein JNK38_25875 [Acidobacteria bacterium]|nr:hypothetical protein [Acidobacteriota bacterium]
MKQIVQRTMLVFAVALFVASVALYRWQPAEAATANGSDSKDTVSTNTSKRTQTTPTFNKEVVRIFQKNCQSCHRAGDIGPFSMMTYTETRPWARAIREAVLSKRMPPWKPAAGCVDLKDARGLSQEEINTIVAWVDGGSPEGALSDAPAPMTFPDGWPLGEPDHVMDIGADYTPPQGKDTYRCFSIPASALRGDRYLQGLDVRPGNRKIVHHVIAYPDPGGKSVALDAADPGPGYTCFGGPGFDISTSVNDIIAGKSFMLGGWAPGIRGYFAPEGVGTKMPGGPNDRVVIQMHYHPTGEAETDRTSVGFYFAKKPVQKNLLLLPLVNTSFTIPAGAKEHVVTQTFDVPALMAGKIVGVTPHMHLLGKQIKVELTRPGQPTECLINVPAWDFNWQGAYLYQSPVSAPGGSRVKLSCTFDNSTDNPFNPSNPPKPVRWGEETTDEMALAFIAFTIDLFSVTPSTPQLSAVTVDANGVLAATGIGFQTAADIEINGRSIRDSRDEAATLSTKVFSTELWKVYAPPGQPVDVTVINPDGVRSPAVKFTRSGSALAVSAVSAANFSADALAPDAIAAAFGTNLATAVAVANTVPLPTELAGTKVRVNGELASLFFVAPSQINFLIPPTAHSGEAVIEIITGNGTISRGTLNLSSVAASLFTSNASGTGAPAAVVTKDGVNFTAVGNADGTSNLLDVGDYLVLFGTGMKKAAPATVRITIGGRDAPVQYIGPQGGYAGLDQLNTQIPAGVTGLVDVVVSINGKATNKVTVRIR